jgi:hypothetical protein
MEVHEQLQDYKLPQILKQVWVITAILTIHHRKQ